MALLPLSAEVAAARAAARLSRLTGRGGGTTVPESCCSGSTRARSSGWPRASPRARCSSPPRTARRRPPRWRPRSSPRASRWRTTRPGRTSSPESRRRCSRRAAPTSRCSRWTRTPSPQWPSACVRERSASATSSATSSTATASSRRSRPAGARRSRRCPENTVVVANADDPQVAELGRGRRHALAFGIDDPAQSLPSLPHAADSKWCLVCGTAYEYAAVYVGHLGDYRCPNCGHARPPLDVAARELELDGLESVSFELSAPAGRRRVRLPVPGLYNVYNALAAASLALTLGVVARRGRSRPRALRARVRATRANRRRRPAPADAADQEPGGRERGDPHPRLRRRAARTRSSRSTTRSPTAATSPGSGTSTSSRSSRGSTPSSRPASGPPSSRSGSSTAASTRTGSRSCRSSGARSTAAWS